MHFPHFYFFVLFFSYLATLLLTTTLHAQATEMEALVVSASRQSLTTDNIAGAVTVISRKDIENSTATSLPELLAGTAGLNLVQTGGVGSQTSLFMRGSESNHTAILVNGQQQKTSLGSVQLQYLDLNQVERIEIIRGPQSSLHGSDAIGGVINIITRTASQNTLTLEQASHRSQYTAFSSGNEQFSFNLSRKSSEGINTLVVDTQNDDDGFVLESASVVYKLKPTDALDTQFIATGHKGITEYDSYPFPASTRPYTDFKGHTVQVVNHYQVNTDWLVQVDIGEAQNESREKDELLAPTGQFSVFTHRTLSLKNLIQANAHWSLAVGVDYAKDTWEQQANFKQSIDNKAAFVFNQYHIDKHLLSLNLRQDDNEQFDTHASYQASYQFKVDEAFTPYVAVGTGFKAPDFDELYSPWYIPNPDLEPESAENVELGFKSTSKLGAIQLAVFKNEIEDFIVYEVVDPLLFTGRLVNLEEVEIKGLELSHHIAFEQLSLSSNVTYTKATNESLNQELLRRPRRVVNIQLDYNFGQVGAGKLIAGLGAHGESVRLDVDADFDGKPEKLAGFMLANAKVDYRLNENTAIYLKANNLLDKEYQQLYGYNADRANFTLGSKITF